MLNKEHVGTFKGKNITQVYFTYILITACGLASGRCRLWSKTTLVLYFKPYWTMV